MRPVIWTDGPDEPRSGLRVVKARWLDGEAGGAQGAAPPAGSRKRSEPDPSTAAAWMHPAPLRCHLSGCGCSQEAQQLRCGISSSSSSSGLHLCRGTRMTGLRVRQAHRYLGGGLTCGLGQDLGQARISSRGGPSRQAAHRGIPAPDGRGHACSARLPARLLQRGASHAHSHLCDLLSGSCESGMGVCHPWALTRETGHPTAQTCSWRTTGQGRLARRVVAAAAVDHANLPACRAPGSAGAASRRAGSPGCGYARSWGTCGPPFSVTGQWWAGGCLTHRVLSCRWAGYRWSVADRRRTRWCAPCASHVVHAGWLIV